ncbi:uncharacterized protein TRIREDRAFT_122293 [Trichoderma reesei QM6a]|uniref:Predicted protein n=1 Tax=Hypocrea jecorina (strain QM6a) TaxID=431241 RepID=G0RL57_HYPJQ|nr:uncharacterized protein TRIREDRAFT_122293 [Trichoderma reesei QM6a]EGR47952.1 predicted protein [Trichoderma reesei QM6a]
MFHMDLGSVRRGGSSPGAVDSAGSGSPLTIGEAIKHEAEAAAPPMTAAMAMPNGGRPAGPSSAADAMETPDAEEMENVTKKRKTGAGGRGVANLTPEQLAKKRANDREAQRAIRERTKNQIERLERRIQELEAQKPYQDLQVVVRAKEAIEAENVEIKRRLASIIGMLQPLVGPNIPGMAPTLPFNAAPLSVGTTNTIAYHHAASASSASPTGVMVDPVRQAAPPPLQSWQSASSSTPPAPRPGGVAEAIDEGTQALLERQGQSLRHGLDFEQGRFDLNVVIDHTQAIPKLQRGLNGAQDSPEYHHVPMKHDWTQVNREFAPQARLTAWQPSIQIPAAVSDSTPAIVPPLGVARQSPITSQPGPGSGSGPGTGAGAPIIPAVPYSNARPAVLEPPPHGYSRPLLNCSPTCPLDALLLDFRSERHQRAAEGFQPHEVAGPRYPSVSSLLNPENSKYSHPVSKFFTDILTKFPEVSGLPEKVAILYLMFLFMRWQISPTKENLERLPEWIRPLPCQFEVPHAAWMDFLPYPEMRERVIKANNPEVFYFDNFFLPFTSTLTLSWPYEEAHTLLRNPDSDEIMINPVFESHMRNLNNWKLGRIFAESFPMLADTCQYHDAVSQGTPK